MSEDRINAMHEVNRIEMELIGDLPSDRKQLLLGQLYAALEDAKKAVKTELGA